MTDLLNERQKTHGDFTFNAMAAQKLKLTFQSMYHDRLSYVQAEALDMIASKISRILSGDPDFKDHWEDIVGYATLALKDTDKRKLLNTLQGAATPTGSGFCNHSKHFNDCEICG